ncbi:MAG: metallophosphoesterase family protein [Bacteroidales bacterium]|nr:metallophosphoesterase family protein [Bacteroidales bacterium]
MFIGVISDTHKYFDENVKNFLKDVDLVLHAGDFGNIETANKIADFKPLKGVYGNCDGTDIREYHPYIQVLDIEGIKILMMHIGGYPGRYDYRAMQLINAHRPDIFICGHSHILKVIYDNKFNCLTINPGAAGIEGFHVVRTAIRFHIDEGKIHDMEIGEWPKKVIKEE